MSNQTKEYLDFLQEMADDAMGMEPGDRLVLADMVKHFRQQSTEVSELKALIADVASAPFPIHDHCSKEHWERACHIYNEATDSGKQ